MASLDSTLWQFLRQSSGILPDYDIALVNDLFPPWP